MIIICKRDFATMRSIKEEIKFEKFFGDMVLESVFERHIKRLIEQFNKYDKEPSKSIRTFFKSCGIAFDTIDASKITIYDRFDKEAEKDIKDCYEDNSKIVIGCMKHPNTHEDMVVGAYIAKNRNNRNENAWHFFPTKEGDMFGHYECNNHNPLKNYQETSKSKFAQTFKKCSEIWIINTNGIAVTDLQRARANAKYGTWQNTPEFYANFAKKNIERYKQLIAKLRMEKGSDFEQLIKETDDLVKLLYETLMDLHKHMGIGDWGQSDRISYAAQEFNSNTSYVLQKLQDVIRQQKEYEDAKKYDAKYGEKANELEIGSGYYLRSYREAIKSCHEYIKRAKEYYEQYKQAKQDWLDKHSD